VAKTSKNINTRNDSYGNDDDEEVKGLDSESEFNEEALQDNLSDDPDISS
jgi:hypothetical protein